MILTLNSKKYLMVLVVLFLSYQLLFCLPGNQIVTAKPYNFVIEFENQKFFLKISKTGFADSSTKILLPYNHRCMFVKYGNFRDFYSAKHDGRKVKIALIYGRDDRLDTDFILEKCEGAYMTNKICAVIVIVNKVYLFEYVLPRYDCPEIGVDSKEFLSAYDDFFANENIERYLIYNGAE